MAVVVVAVTGKSGRGAGGLVVVWFAREPMLKSKSK
jgi:hypothetical protein